MITISQTLRYSFLVLLSHYCFSQSTLKEAYKDAFKMGVAVNDGIVSGQDKSSQEIVVKQFNSITIENSMKAERINPKPNVFNYAPADAFVEFGKKNNMFIICLLYTSDAADE